MFFFLVAEVGEAEKNVTSTCSLLPGEFVIQHTEGLQHCTDVLLLSGFVHLTCRGAPGAVAPVRCSPPGARHRPVLPGYCHAAVQMSLSAFGETEEMQHLKSSLPQNVTNNVSTRGKNCCVHMF